MAGSLIATACGDAGVTANDPARAVDEPDDPAAVDGPRTVAINVDGEIEGSNVALLGYFPRQTTVRQGDTVEFAFQPGDPHTVSFGTLVDQAFAEMASEQEPAALAKVPFAFSDNGPPQLLYGGALPCFAADDPPTDGSPCEPVDQPPFDGTLAFYNSGLLEPGSTFEVDIAPDTAPGTYNFLCVLHGPDMSASITVVAADGDGQTADEVEAARAADLEAVAAAAAPMLAALPNGVHPELESAFGQGPDQVVAGGFLPEPVPVDVLQFGPAEVTIAAGASVTWNVVGFHTISFNAPKDATPPIAPGADGLPTLNELAFAPQGGAAGMPPPPEDAGDSGDDGPPGEEGPPPPATALDGGQWDGTGFFSSGVLPSFPPMLVSYEITFTTPGTYTYQCLIHPDMEGKVTVS